MNTLTGLLPSSSVPGCQIVNVPGQKFWHTHVCPRCQSSWTHIAPTPMTQAVNRKIHTCTKCGTFVYTFQRLEEVSVIDEIPPIAWVAGGVLLAGLVTVVFDRA